MPGSEPDRADPLLQRIQSVTAVLRHSVCLSRANIKHMIPETEVPAFIHRHVPDMSVALPAATEKGYIYKDLYALMQHTCDRIADHNYLSVRKCFTAADKLYAQGSRQVRNAIENVYVYSFTNMLNRYPAEKKDVLALIPVTLYTLYIGQLHAKGC